MIGGPSDAIPVAQQSVSGAQTEVRKGEMMWVIFSWLASVFWVVFSALTVLVSQSVSVTSTSFLLGTSATCSNSGKEAS